VPDLVLLNGPPASGKSTLAVRLIESRPLALDLDVDVVRALLGRWLDDPTGAGLAARTLALAMARAHLRAGHDVFVPQFIGRVEFVEQLEAVAAEEGARFIEIALVLDRTEAIEAFQRRRNAPEEQAHLDAAGLVDRSTSADPVGEMYDRYAALLESRPHVHRVPVRSGDIDATVATIEALLS
jgi:predicted kinase